MLRNYEFVEHNMVKTVMTSLNSIKDGSHGQFIVFTFCQLFMYLSNLILVYAPSHI